MLILVGERANGEAALSHDLSAECRLTHGAFRWGPAHDRLRSLGLGWDLAANLLPRMPRLLAPAEPRLARQAAENLAVWASRHRNVLLVLCGARVAGAFGLAYEPLCEDQWLDVEGGHRVHVLQSAHPSGLCRWWNEGTNVGRARAAFARATGMYKDYAPVPDGTYSDRALVRKLSCAGTA